VQGHLFFGGGGYDGADMYQGRWGEGLSATAQAQLHYSKIPQNLQGFAPWDFPRGVDNIAPPKHLVYTPHL